MGARRLLEFFDNRAPFPLAVAKPLLLGHVRPLPRKIAILRVEQCAG
jgi:hypothetical protein